MKACKQNGRCVISTNRSWWARLAVTRAEIFTKGDGCVAFSRDGRG